MDRWLFLRSIYLIILVLLLMLVVPAYASNILDDVGQTYYNASRAWETNLIALAKSLFIKLALLEILWFAIWWTIERDDARQFIVQLLRKIMGLLFFWAILLNFDTWIPAIINSFSQAGQTAGGVGPLTPSTVLDRGLEIATKIVETANNIGLLDGPSGLGKYLLAALVSLLIVIAFAVVAGQMLITLIESYLVANAGVLFLGFAGSRWTTTFAEKFISYTASVGVKLFVTYLIIGTGQTISDGWANTITTDMVVGDYLSVLVGAIVYTFIAWHIPSLAASMLTGAVSMTLGSAAATAGTTVAGTLGVAGMTAAASGASFNSVAGAVKTGSAAIHQAKEKNSSSITGFAGHTLGALASGITEAARDNVKGLGSQSAGASLANRINHKTAGIREMNAAADVSAPSVVGSQMHSPEIQNASAAVNSSIPIQSTNKDSTSSTANDQSAAISATSNSVAAQSTTNTYQHTHQPTRDKPPAPLTPDVMTHSASANPHSKRRFKNKEENVFSKLAQHAETITQTPNDSASNAGIQIELKHD